MIDKFYLDKDRIPVFIGKNGSQKKQFEKKLNAKIKVNSKTGEVTINSDEQVSDFILKNIITAINYGQNPINALKLENENYVLDIIDVKRYLRNEDIKNVKRVLGRVIGKDGSTRKTTEEITKCSISVKDHFITVIGPFENISLIHDAYEMLIKGASHKKFYAYLEKNKIKDF